MTNFRRLKPVRIRVEGEGVNVDVIVPAYLLIFPAPESAGAQLGVHGQHANVQEASTLIAGVARYGVHIGVMQMVMADLCSTPLQLFDGQIKGPPPAGSIPPDDLPPHLRGR